jgi:ABC-2 type transport system permease protein
MNLSRIFAITGRVIAQFRRDHRTLGLIFIAPILIMSIFGYVFRSQESDTVKVALVNEDRPPAGQSTLAAPIIDNLKSNADLVITEMPRQAAEAAVRDGSQRVAIIFGTDFSASLRANRNATIDVIVEGSNPTQAAGALGTVGQAVLAGAPVVLKSILPPPMNALAPDTPPLKLNTVRLYGSEDIKPLDFFAPMFIAYIGFFLVFLLTSVSFLRERTQGTMERLMASPVTRLDLVLGYMLGFGFFSLLQSIVLLLFTIYALQIKYEGNILAIFVVSLALV